MRHGPLVFVHVALLGYGRSQAADDPRQLSGLFHEPGECALANMRGVEGDIELGTHFRAGCLGRGEELVELRPSTLLKAFRNVRHDRHSRAANLVPQAEVSCERPLFRYLIDFSCQDPCLLPSNQILKSLNPAHPSFLMAHASRLKASFRRFLARASSTSPASLSPAPPASSSSRGQERRSPQCRAQPQDSSHPD